MRVLMLGWEFPPYISGGLGTACFGLTRAMSRQNIEVVFVLPKAVGEQPVTHIRLLPRTRADAARQGSANGHHAPAEAAELTEEQSAATAELGKLGPAFQNVTFRTVPARLTSPYQAVGAARGRGGRRRRIPGLLGPSGESTTLPGVERVGAITSSRFEPGQNPMYGGDLLAESRRYAQMCVQIAASERFDIIHAHDWLSFPAGLAVAAATGKPLVVHVHSTEFDRSGLNIHQPIYDIERRGMHGAMRVICVSYLTKSIVQHRYGVDPAKIDVVYNGIETNGQEAATHYAWRFSIRKGDKIVLFLGRVTMQKGPEYFIAAARKVLEKYAAVKFVMAGSGDQIANIMQLAEASGIGDKVVFTGFLRGKDVERVFKMADVYVMPSVSEPFGIAPLEAIAHDVPVIISRQSGVAEVLNHALKVDFWDTDDIANKILAVLKHPPLSSTLREHADVEVRKLTWDDAASRCRSVYELALGMMPH